nr:toprim domain-containing protein [uncultured Cohaesibacter sp.]
MTLFDDWKEEARAVPVLKAAQMCGAKLERAGGEYKGPCPMGCSSHDGFIVTPSKNLFLCRKGDAHGDAIELVKHCMGYDFIKACAFLTGRPAPNGREGQIDPAAVRKAAARREQAEQEQQRQNELTARKCASKRQSAYGLWKQARPIKASMAEAYAVRRHIGAAGSIPSLRFHPEVYNEDIRRPCPALLGLVIGPDKGFCGVWRIFLKEGGMKADVPRVKKGLGSAKGGAVWIASQEEALAPVWGICEGIETALSVRQLFGLPVFAALSTSGVAGFKVPPHVTHLVIYPDGDVPTQRKQGGWNAPPGMHAAAKLAARLKQEHLSHCIEQPPRDGDWNDILVTAQEKQLV